MDKFWFLLSSHVFLWKKGNTILAYHEENFNKVEFESNSLFDIKYDEFKNLVNLYCVEVTQKELDDVSFASCVNRLVEAGMAKIIACDSIAAKPVSLPPVLSLQRRREKFVKDPKMAQYENFLYSLYELTIYLNGDNVNENIFCRQLPCLSEGKTSLDYKELEFFLLNLVNSSVKNIRLTGTDVFLYNRYADLINLLDKMRLTKYLYASCLQIIENEEKVQVFSAEQFKLVIVIDKKHLFDERIIEVIKKGNLHCIYQFFVTSIEEYMYADSVIEKWKIEVADIKPVYTGNNLSFFEENVYASKEDIFAMKLNKRKVFAHQALNTNDFGKLTIVPDGTIFANLNFEEIGNIHSSDIRETVYQEIISGRSWLRIREQKPCCGCLYQWLCPSPSNYELVIGKSNLCHIKCDLGKDC